MCAVGLLQDRDYINANRLIRIFLRKLTGERAQFTLFKKMHHFLRGAFLGRRLRFYLGNHECGAVLGENVDFACFKLEVSRSNLEAPLLQILARQILPLHPQRSCQPLFHRPP